MTTELSIRPDMIAATVAQLYPETTPVLARFGIDLCCGGSRSLEFIARAHGFDLGALLTELEAARAR